MAITYTIDETFTGKRTIQMPDPDKPGQMKNIVSDVKDIQVTFKSDSPKIDHTRTVNVCYDSGGNYDHANTVARIEEVKNGFAHKVEAGAIIEPQDV